MSTLLNAITPFWRGVLVTLAIIELPRWVAVWYGQSPRDLGTPAIASFGGAFANDSALVVRLATAEGAELPSRHNQAARSGPTPCARWRTTCARFSPHARPRWYSHAHAWGPVRSRTRMSGWN